MNAGNQRMPVTTRRAILAGTWQHEARLCPGETAGRPGGIRV